MCIYTIGRRYITQHLCTPCGYTEDLCVCYDVMGFPCPIHNRVIIAILIEHFMLKGGKVMIGQIMDLGNVVVNN